FVVPSGKVNERQQDRSLVRLAFADFRVFGDPVVAHPGDDGLFAGWIDRQSGASGGGDEGREAVLDDELQFLAAGEQRGGTAQQRVVGVPTAAGAEIDHVG